MSQWIMSVDLGQTIDPTAVAVLEVTTRQDVVDRIYATDPPGPPPPDYGTWYGDNGRLQDPGRPARIDVRHLERFPLRMTYPDQVARVARMLARPPLPPGTQLVVDQTGVGRPVVDMFDRAGLRPIGVTITGGDSANQAGWSPVEWRVAKLLLVSKLQAALHGGELRIAKELPEAQTLAHELQEFRAQFTPSGYARFGAREGAHDDLVLALAIGIWWATAQPSPATWGTYLV